MSPVSILAVGDVLLNRAHPDGMFDAVRTTLLRADVVFGQIEAVYTEHEDPIPTPGRPLRASPSLLKPLREAGFTVCSVAGNHCMDYGARGLFDMIGAMRAAGLHAVGAGANIAEAMRPAIQDVRGTKVAFLAFNSILAEATWATGRRAGCAPLRVHTHYEMVEPHQPGCPARARTFVHDADLRAAYDAVAEAKACADVVFVSLHWGLHFTPHRLADYERPLAHALIDAGADAILGSHPHLLKPIEIYRDKVIAFSMGNFAFDLELTEGSVGKDRHDELAALYPVLGRREAGSPYPFPPESRLSGIFCFEVVPDSRIEFRMLPVLIATDSTPRLLQAGDPRIKEILDFVGPDSAALGTRLVIDETGAIRPLAGTASN